MADSAVDTFFQESPLKVYKNADQFTRSRYALYRSTQQVYLATIINREIKTCKGCCRRYLQFISQTERMIYVMLLNKASIKIVCTESWKARMRNIESR